MRSIEDLIGNAVEEKPREFYDAFNDLMLDKIRDAIEQKKEHIARVMYNYEPEAEVDAEET